MKIKTYTMYYRTGGTENFEWHKAFPVGTKEEAIAQVAEQIVAGRVAHYMETDMLNIGGLPETYDAKGSIR